MPPHLRQFHVVKSGVQEVDEIVICGVGGGCYRGLTTTLVAEIRLSGRQTPRFHLIIWPSKLIAGLCGAV